MFVRYLNANDNSLRSDLLHSVNLSTTTRGEDIHGQILDFFNLHELDFQKLVGCCSDGAAPMMGIHKGFVARIRPIAQIANLYIVFCPTSASSKEAFPDPKRCISLHQTR